MPKLVEPALATLVDDVPTGDEWLFEIKFDGYRILTVADGDDVRCYTRNGLDWTARFGGLPDAVAKLHLDRALLDGELVAIGEDGRTDFSALQDALTPRRQGTVLLRLRSAVRRRQGSSRAAADRAQESTEELLAGAGMQGLVFLFRPRQWRGPIDV